ncbi:unnamed protein product [Paramecium pentaurelia]|uniref:Casein kinase I n=1 Tax=Paramecium pentaurelia TaxID=43138 RepID=A0A8S1WR99_9CILI|nr:unnamed protein product [Paramecium pentaurelia]
MACIQQYKVLSNIGCGSEHLVYKAQFNLNSELYAIKMEKSPRLGQLENEIEMLQKLNGVEGVPQIKQFGLTQDKKCFLIVPLLHSSLLDLSKSGSLSLPLILTIGLGVIQILERVHKKEILHLDIKPENIMLSQQISNDQDVLKPGLIQLIDFGLSQQFIKNSETLKDVFIGSLNFASRSSHQGKPIGYRDDLESLLYVLCYLKDLKLPWSEKQFWGFKEVDLDKIGNKKSSFFKTILLQQQSYLNFQPFMSYIDGLKHDIMPDYNFIKELFTLMIQRANPFQSSLKQWSQIAFCTSIQIKTLLHDSENIKNSLQNIQQQYTTEEIIDDEFLEKNIVFLSDVIGNYTTNSIKSIKDIKLQKVNFII